MHNWKSGHFDTLPSGIQPVAQVKHSTAHFCCLPKAFKCSQIDLQPTKGKNWFIQLWKSSFYLGWVSTFSSLNSSIRLLILTTRDFVSHHSKSRVQSTVPLEGFSNQLCTLDEFFGSNWSLHYISVTFHLKMDWGLFYAEVWLCVGQ